MMKSDLTPGSAYAAIMVTGGHGVRMQDNFTGDIAGPADLVFPQWLRLTRTGGEVTGFASVDGTTWSAVGTVTPGLPSTVAAGMFVTAPPTRPSSSSSAAAGWSSVARRLPPPPSIPLRCRATGPANGRGEAVGPGLDADRLAGIVGVTRAAGIVHRHRGR